MSVRICTIEICRLVNNRINLKILAHLSFKGGNAAEIQNICHFEFFCSMFPHLQDTRAGMSITFAFVH